MSDFYNDFAATANEMIAEFGMEVEWTPARPQSGPDYDPTPGDAPEPYKPRAAFFPNDAASARGLTAITGRDAPSANEYCLLAGNCGFEVAHTDTIKRGNDNLTIVDFNRLAPAGVPVLFIVWVN